MSKSARFIGKEKLNYLKIHHCTSHMFHIMIQHICWNVRVVFASFLFKPSAACFTYDKLYSFLFSGNVTAWRDPDVGKTFPLFTVFPTYEKLWNTHVVKLICFAYWEKICYNDYGGTQQNISRQNKKCLLLINSFM